MVYGVCNANTALEKSNTVNRIAEGEYLGECRNWDEFQVIFLNVLFMKMKEFLPKGWAGWAEDAFLCQTSVSCYLLLMKACFPPYVSFLSTMISRSADELDEAFTDLSFLVKTFLGLEPPAGFEGTQDSNSRAGAGTVSALVLSVVFLRVCYNNWNLWMMHLVRLHLPETSVCFAVAGLLGWFLPSIWIFNVDLSRYFASLYALRQ